MTSLVADCANCFALCCTALPFARSADFAIDKPAGVPCANLVADYRCRIHRELRANGFGGCVGFDCFGAGQHVSQGTFGGVSWRDARAVKMFEAFDAMRQLHELLWYLTDAGIAADIRAEQLYGEIEDQSNRAPEELVAIDLTRLRATVDAVLTSCSAQLRARHPKSKSFRGKDLLGRRLTQLRGAELRGALLIAADLSEQDLADADLLGADLRDADLSGADLSGALFLTQAQVNSARGDDRTRLPVRLTRPAHWD